MSEKMRGGIRGKSFRDKELALAAGLVRESMLSVLPEPEACVHQFSPEFQTKMERLFAKDRVYHTLYTIRRYAAAIILLILFTAGVVLAVDTEARASFFEWVKKIYENSIVYEFFGGVQEEGLPTYELGWVPEGYEAVDVYRDETTYSALYQKGDDINSAFVYEYQYGHSGILTELIGDLSKYECKLINVNGATGEFYRSLDGTETNQVIWFNKNDSIVFLINGYLNEVDMLHMAEEIFLCKRTN